MFRAKHHSDGEEPVVEKGMYVATKNSSVSFKDRGRFYAQPIAERTLHSGSANIEGNYCIGSNNVLESSVKARNGVANGPYKDNGEELRRFLTGKDTQLIE